VTLEVAAETEAEADAARRAGADRVEMCRDLDEHGLSPDPARVRRAASGGPVLAMLRPRPGGFVLGPGDLDAMQAEAEAMRGAGAAGLVFGALTPAGRVDAEATRRLVESAAGAQSVFHRAFDLVDDAGAGLETLIEAGVTRVLTAGEGPAAAAASLGLAPGPGATDSILARAARVGWLIALADGRIEVIACGGIRASNVRAFLDAGCGQVHAACRGGGGLRAEDVAGLRRAVDEATM
jgi:copper homeostasis protein